MAAGLLFGSAPAARAALADGAKLRQVDQLLAKDYPAGTPGAAVLVARGDQVLLRRGYGTANLATGERMAPNREFRVASVSKQFTAVAVLQLAAAGRLGLDDLACKYLPDYLPAGGWNITIRELLAHSSGLKNYSDLDAFRDEPTTPLSTRQLWAMVRGYGVSFEPGTAYEYCNTGYMLLGAIVERVSGQPFGDYLEQHVLRPAGLSRTWYGPGRRGQNNGTPGYSPEIGARGRYEPAIVLEMSQANAAGGLISCVDDLYKWERALERGQVLGPSWVQLARTAFRFGGANEAVASLAADKKPGFGDANGQAPYGLGWELETIGGKSAVGHGGTMAGFRSYEIAVPSTGVYVTILCNCDRPMHDPADVAAQVIRLLQ